VTVGVLAVILARALVVMAAEGGMLVRSAVWVGVAQRAVTVCVALEEFVGGGGHVGQARPCWRRPPAGRPRCGERLSGRAAGSSVVLHAWLTLIAPLRGVPSSTALPVHHPTLVMHNDREDRMSMAEIRRIADGEGGTAAALWDEQNRTGIDGSPLSERAAQHRPDARNRCKR
jgi:hypothetical protein